MEKSMEKSKMYEVAALSVMKNAMLPDVNRLEIIEMLLEKKQFEKYAEKRKEKSNEH
jgi:hypothetical protein